MSVSPSASSSAVRTLVTFASTTTVLAGVVLASCGDGSHAYVGRLYDPARDCLEPSTTLDVVNGAEPGGDCAPGCLAAPATDGGVPGVGAVVVGTMCPPYPPTYTAGPNQPGCAAAFAAYARGDSCLEDGGASNPLPDAGSADASTD